MSLPINFLPSPSCPTRLITGCQGVAACGGVAVGQDEPAAPGRVSLHMDSGRAAQLVQGAPAARHLQQQQEEHPGDQADSAAACVPPPLRFTFCTVLLSPIPSPMTAPSFLNSFHFLHIVGDPYGVPPTRGGIKQTHFSETRRYNLLAPAEGFGINIL